MLDRWVSFSLRYLASETRDMAREKAHLGKCLRTSIRTKLPSPASTHEARHGGMTLKSQHRRAEDRQVPGDCLLIRLAEAESPRPL